MRSELSDVLRPYHLEQLSTAYPTPTADNVLGVDWYLLTTYYLHLIWPAQTTYPDNILIQTTGEDVASVYSSILTPEANSFVTAIRTSIYNKFLGGPERSPEYHIASTKYTVIFTVLTYSSNYSTANTITANALNQNIARLSLPILQQSGFSDLQTVQITGGSTQASFNPPPPLPAPDESYVYIILGVFLFVFFALTALLCWRRPTLRTKFLGGLLRMRSAVSSPFRSTPSSRYRFRKLQRSVSDEADTAAIFNRAGLEMEPEDPEEARQPEFRDLPLK